MKLANKGRYGDTKLRNVKGELSHVNPQEASLIDIYMGAGEEIVSQSGSGTMNPETGLREYHWRPSKGHWGPHSLKEAGDYIVDTADDFAESILGDDYLEGDFNILGLGDEVDRILSDDWQPINDLVDWVEDDTKAAVKNLNDWVKKDVGKIFAGKDAFWTGNGYYTGDDRNDDGVIDQEDVDIYDDLLKNDDDNDGIHNDDDDDYIPPVDPDAPVDPDVMSSTYETELAKLASGYKTDLERVQGDFKEQVDPGGTGKPAADLRRAIQGEQTSGGAGTRISEVLSAPSYVTEGPPGGVGENKLDELSLIRETARDDLEIAYGLAGDADAPLESGQGAWKTAKLLYAGQEDTYLEEGENYVSTAEITNTDHQSDDYGFQDGNGVWHYYQGIDSTDVDLADKITDNAATDWIDESKYSSDEAGGAIDEAERAAQDAGMTSWTWDADFEHEDGTTGKWVSGLGQLGIATGNWDTAMGTYSQAQTDFRMAGDYFWMSGDSPQGYTVPEGAPSGAPNYAVTDPNSGQAVGYWQRGTWGQAQDLYQQQIETWEKAQEDYGTGNRSAWDVWKEQVAGMGKDAMTAGAATAASSGKIRSDATEVLRQTGMSGSGSIERARDLDLQDLATDYGSVSGDWTGKLGATRRRLEAQLDTNEDTRDAARYAFSGAGGAMDQFANATTAYGSDVPNEFGVQTGIFGTMETAEGAKDAADSLLGHYQGLSNNANTAITTARQNFLNAGLDHDININALRDAYRLGGPPTTEGSLTGADAWDPTSEFLSDELEGLGKPGGGQIYDNWGKAQNVWEDARDLSKGLHGWDFTKGYDSPIDWGTDYTDQDWMTTGLDEGGAGLAFDQAYGGFQNTLLDYGVPGGLSGDVNYANLTSNTAWGTGGFNNVYKELYDYFQPGGGYSGNVGGALGSYDSALTGTLNTYLGQAQSAIGSGPGKPGTYQSLLHGPLPEGETFTDEHYTLAGTEADKLQALMYGGDKAGSNWKSSMMEQWQATPTNIADSWKDQDYGTGDWDISGYTVPGYNTIEDAWQPHSFT